MENPETEALCGADCGKCGFKTDCKGCRATCGSPFGGRCIAAEYIKVGGKSAFEKFKRQIISEFNALEIEGMPEITELYCLCGSFVNLEYPLPSGKTAKFLNDQNIYLGTQADCEFVDRCFGLVADMNFLLVCEYGENGTNPDIVAYRKR